MLAESGEAVRVVAPSWIVDGGAAATANRRAGRATADGEGDGDDKFESSLSSAEHAHPIIYQLDHDSAGPLPLCERFVTNRS